MVITIKPQPISKTEYRSHRQNCLNTNQIHIIIKVKNETKKWTLTATWEAVALKNEASASRSLILASRESNSASKDFPLHCKISTVCFEVLFA